MHNNKLQLLRIAIRADEARAAAAAAACTQIGLSGGCVELILSTLAATADSTPNVFVFKGVSEAQIMADADQMAARICSEASWGITCSAADRSRIGNQLLDQANRRSDWMDPPAVRNQRRGLVVAPGPRAFGSVAPTNFVSLADKFYNGKIRSHPDLATM